jgi:hypothetical protein
MKYIFAPFLIIYVELRLLAYDFANFLEESKRYIVAKDEKKATEMLGKAVSWIIAIGVFFIIYGTIKGLSR